MLLASEKEKVMNTNGATSTRQYDQSTLLAKYSHVTQKMYRIMKSKNADYAGLVGDPFANFELIEVLSKGVISREMGTVVRMSDKLSRVIRLLQNSNQVLDEKIEDTLLDLANYSILLVLMLEEGRERDPLAPAISAARSAFANIKLPETPWLSELKYPESGWGEQLSKQDATAEEVMELTEHVQCRCLSCVHARLEGVEK